MSRKMKFGILGLALVSVAIFAVMTLTSPGAAFTGCAANPRLCVF